jgi:predicted negative regulator of RcsB-dependent stress response
MVEIYDSHEQSERVKGWLAENGGAIVLGLVLAFGSLFGFKQWQLWQQNEQRQASVEYELLLEFLGEGNLDAAVANYETLKKGFEGSAYTALAALHMARARIEAGQTELAEQLLEYAMNQGEPAAVRSVARERLARVKLALGQADAALALLDAAQSAEGFEARFAEIRGDAARTRGEHAAAAEYYAQALDLLEAGTGDRAWLEIKLAAAKLAAGTTGDAS